MNDKNFKDMWQKASYFIGDSRYEFSSIEKFISSSSKLVSEKIGKMYKFDIIYKSIIILILILDAFLYFNTQQEIAYICIFCIPLVALILRFELSLFNKFQTVSDNIQSTNAKLSGMLQFLRSQSFVSLLSISTTYLFGFTGGILMYFFVEYGELRRMGSLDIFVFPAICLMGILFTYINTSNTIKFQIKHLELCLSDLDEKILPYITDRIEGKQRNERTRTFLIGAVVLLGFLVLIAILKAKGF